jgi:hypothetical protein
VIELSSEDVTSGVARPTAAEIDKQPKQPFLTVQENPIQILNGTRETRNMY